MNPLVHHLVTMAHNNAWANLRLLRAAATLDHVAFVAPRTGFFPSIMATLNHNLTVDWFYVAAIERGIAGLPVDPDGRRCFDPELPFDACGPLATAQREVDARLIAVCRGLHDDDLARTVAIPWRSGVAHETTVRVLAHLFEHQIHHRGQAHAMLSGTAVAPPQLDEFFCANDAPLRAADFAELGWTESMIWDPPRG